MSADEVLRKLRGAPQGKRVVYVSCPFCESEGKRDKKRSLAYWVKSGWFKCYRCEHTGRLEDIEAAGLSAPPEDTEAVPINLPEGFVLLAEVWNALSYEDAVNHAKDRGVDRAIAEELKVGATLVGKAHHRIVAPILGLQDELLGWVGRDWSGQQDRKYLYAEGMRRGDLVYNPKALWVPTRVPLLVVEGWLDCVPHRPHASAVLGMPSEEQMQLLLQCSRPVVFVLDGDAWRIGHQKALELRVMGKLDAGSVRLDPGMDPDELSTLHLMELALDSLEDELL